MKEKYKVPESLKKKLQDAVDYLTEHPKEISDAWLKIYDHEHGCLFRYVHPKGDGTGLMVRKDGKSCGCLSMIKSGAYHAFTDELTVEIKADERLPTMQGIPGPEFLPVFQEWMLKLAVIYKWQS